MKGSQKVIDKLNYLLAGELTAINQYMLHAEMCEDWGYSTLHKVDEKRAIDEMHHAEKLIERILFLEGQPIVSNLNEIHIGADVPKQVGNDHQSEIDTVHDYNEAIKLCQEEYDNGTKDLLENILADEERHVDELEAQQDQMEQIGTELFLAMQKPVA